MPRFPVKDCTYRKGRMQSEVAKEIRERYPEKSLDTKTDEEVLLANAVPKNPTLERAIKYYESNAEGEYKSLYLNTVEWLKLLLTKPKYENIKNEEKTADEAVDEVSL